LHGEKLEAAKSEIQQLLDSGAIRPSSSPWSSPLHMVRKSQPGSWRACGDYRQLNSITVPDRYPIPHLHSCTNRLANANIFTKLDLERAYHQVRVHPDDVQKTAITTPFGLFEYVSMPFGLRNAAQTFQRHMDCIFRDCEYVTAYLDDILIASPDKKSHLHHIETVFSRLSKHQLRVNINKCCFFQSSVIFLGHSISSKGILPSPDRISALQDFPKPNDYASLRRFLGMANFYRRFIPMFAKILEPLQALINSTKNVKEPLNWTDSANDAFLVVKQALADSVTLSYPDKSPSYQLVTDASQSFIGAALHHTDEKSQARPIAFFSKKLSSTQQSYSTYDRELLAAYLAAKHFQSYIEGTNVLLLSDHKPLVTAFHSRSRSQNDRQQRHLSFLTEICSDAQYIRGSDNVVADALSRPISSVSIDPFDLSHIATEQAADETTPKDSLTSHVLPDGKTLFCDSSTPIPRPFLPISCRERAFSEIHSLSHPGVRSTIKAMKSRYVWPSIEKDIKQLCRQCLSCQEAKISRHTKSSPKEFSIPSNSRFECVHMDLVGPLPVAYSEDSPPNSPGFKYLATFIDRASSWIEACPLFCITAAAVAEAFVTTWVSRFGVPLYLITDRGKQFESDLFSKLSSILGFHRLRTAAYHPQSNGKIERAHRTIKTAVKARKRNWFSSVPVILMSLRSIPNASGISPFTAVTGSQIIIPPTPFKDSTEHLPLPEFVQKLAKQMQSLQYDFSSPRHAGGVYLPTGLTSSSHVWVRTDRVLRPLEAPYSGPYRVLQRSEKTFTIQLPSGKTDVVAIDRLKPAVLRESTETRSLKPTEQRTQITETNSDYKRMLRSNKKVSFDM